MNDKWPNQEESSESERFFRRVNTVWDKGEVAWKETLQVASSVVGGLMAFLGVLMICAFLVVIGVLLISWFSN